MKGFYLVCFLLSFSLFLWQSVSDARQSVVQRTALLIVIISNGGYLALAGASNLTEAVLATKILYVAACFLPMLYFIKKGQTESFQMLALLSLVSSLLVTIVSLATYQPLFKMLNVPADAYQDACDYMKIICCGTVFVFGYNAVCSVLKGLEDSKSPLYFVGIATVINIVLDIILVGPLGMGTAGAAYATITAQGISFVISLFYLKRHKIFFSMENRGKFTLQWDKLTAIVKVGLPTAIQMVVVNTAYLLVAGMLNQFGTAVSAASNVGLQINTFAGMPCWAIGQAVTAMAGQCMGAGQIERARKVVKISLMMNVAVTLVVVIGVQLFAEPLILLFGSTTPEVVNDGVYYLCVCCSINSLIYAKMKEHPAIGARIVKEVLTDVEAPDFVTVAVNVAHYHHEKVDGTGYPCGLKSTEIPVEARIMALADVFDALVSKRCYKEAFSFDKAFSIIAQDAGTHFDPELASVFLRCRPQLEHFYQEQEKDHEQV